MANKRCFIFGAKNVTFLYRTMEIGNTIIRKINRHQNQSHNSTARCTYLNLTGRIFPPWTQKNLQPLRQMVISGRKGSFLLLALALSAYFSSVHILCTNLLHFKSLWVPCTVWRKNGTRLAQKTFENHNATRLFTASSSIWLSIET